MICICWALLIGSGEWNDFARAWYAVTGVTALLSFVADRYGYRWVAVSMAVLSAVAHIFVSAKGISSPLLDGELSQLIKTMRITWSVPGLAGYSFFQSVFFRADLVVFQLFLTIYFLAILIFLPLHSVFLKLHVRSSPSA
jgi:hypothetical protein